MDAIRPGMRDRFFYALTAEIIPGRSKKSRSPVESNWSGATTEGRLAEDDRGLVEWPASECDLAEALK